jgi:hypothetical protein
MFEQKRYDFILEATRPIVHLSETIGNRGVIARRKVRLPDGEWADVPMISGNQIRHKLRAAGTWCLLDALGMSDTEELLEPTLRLLFNGGELKKKGSGGAMNFESYRTLCEMIPTIALLGGCANGTINEGQGSVDYALLICDETTHIMPAWVGEYLESVGTRTDEARAHVEEIQNVRGDSVTSPSVNRLLTPGEKVRVNAKLLAKSTAHDKGEEVDADAKSRMLPYSTESIAMGSLFYWSVAFNVYSEVQLDTLNTMVAAWLARPNVGGRSGSGHGELRLVTARNVKIARPSETAQTMAMSELAPKVGSMFYAHVQERADRIKEYLQRVEA